MLEACHRYFHGAADVLNLSDRVRQILITPRRVVKVELVIEDDEGQLLHHRGFRVQHNDTRGPFKGGLRYHPTMDEAYASVLEIAKQKSVDLRTAAFVLGIRRVLRAAISRRASARRSRSTEAVYLLETVTSPKTADPEIRKSRPSWSGSGSAGRPRRRRRP